MPGAMPELPDIEGYLHALRPRVLDRRIERIRIVGPFFLRSVQPPIEAAEGRTVRTLARLGKRVVFGLDDDLYLVVHLMIAGRFRWFDRPPKRPPRIALAVIELADGSLVVTEAAKKKRASLHVVRGASELRSHDPGGIEPLEATLDEFAAVLCRENHTLKRALTDPRLFAGIGNAYSDEILHAARLSPVRLTQKLDDAEIARLHAAMQRVLRHWTDELCRRFAGRFPGPGEVTAFRDGFAVHGRFGKPCPVCGRPVQRIRYAENETNYCAVCQTEGRLLADRSLSRLLREDWPRRLTQE